MNSKCSYFKRLLSYDIAFLSRKSLTNYYEFENPIHIILKTETESSFITFI